MEVRKLFAYVVVFLVAAIPTLCFAITADPFTSSGTQGPSYIVEWSNEIILPYEYAGQPNISANGNKIVFLKYKSQEDYQNELWIANSDGTNEKVLLAEQRTDYNSAILSPDGTKIVFLKNSEFEMWMTNADGTGTTPLTEKKYEKFNPQFMPDGSKIIFGLLGIDPPGLYALDLTNNEQHLIYSTKGLDFLNPSFTISPDGQTILVLYKQDLLFLNPDGTLKEKKTVNTPLVLGEEPVWSPNGKYIILGNILYVIATGEELPFFPKDVVTYKEEGKPDLVGPHSISMSKDGGKIVFEMEATDDEPYRAKIKILDLTWK